MPCVDLVIIRPTNAEIDFMSEKTKRAILADDQVITVACTK